MYESALFPSLPIFFKLWNNNSVGAALGVIIAIIMSHHIKNILIAIPNDHPMFISLDPMFISLDPMFISIEDGILKIPDIFVISIALIGIPIPKTVYNPVMKTIIRSER